MLDDTEDFIERDIVRFKVLQARLYLDINEPETAEEICRSLLTRHYGNIIDISMLLATSLNNQRRRKESLEAFEFASEAIESHNYNGCNDVTEFYGNIFVALAYEFDKRRQ